MVFPCLIRGIPIPRSVTAGAVGLKWGRLDVTRNPLADEPLRGHGVVVTDGFEELGTCYNGTRSTGPASRGEP